MASAQPIQKGVTPPISVSLPTAPELAANDALIDELKSQNNFESPEETERRKKVLQTLQKVTLQFVKEAMTKKGSFSQSVINAAGGKIFTFGSYRLGVYGPGSDIDTLVVAPKHITREDYFEIFPPVLERMSSAGAIEEITPVPDAYVPIIKLEYLGISIDLIFASIQLASVSPSLDLKDNNLLRGLDDSGLRSLNGTRVTDELLDLVPQQKTFRTALRAVKLWAKRRGVYGNIYGFPGGVAWAMSVARVCQLYPQATGSVIVGKFFRIIGKWAWPQPIVLKEIESGPLPVRVWNPQLYKGDRMHLMPIITPAYPSMCATHNISLSTKEIMLKELGRGGDIVDKIFTKQLQWKDLFERHTFFTQGYKYYLSVVSTSRSKESQLLWSGLVNSKVRHLVVELQTDPLIKIAHPYNEGFDREHRCETEDQCTQVTKGSLAYQATDVKTETAEAANDPRHAAAAQGGADNITLPADAGDSKANGSTMTLHTTTYYIGLELEPDAKKLDVSWCTNNFREMCQSWANYNPDINFLTVAHTRNVDLPDDVFKPGEVKPSKPAKKKGSKKKEDSVTNKRKLEDADGVNGQNGAKRRHSENPIA